jgi:Bacterial regulatory proteins, luxR family
MAPVHLTELEIRILELLSTGLVNAGIADQLGLAEKTVENNLTVIYSKLGIEPGKQNRRALATAWFLANKTNFAGSSIKTNFDISSTDLADDFEDIFIVNSFTRIVNSATRQIKALASDSESYAGASPLDMLKNRILLIRVMSHLAHAQLNDVLQEYLPQHKESE